MRSNFHYVIIASLLFCAPVGIAEAAEATETAEIVTVVIRPPAAPPLSLTVEVADTPAERRWGLSNRQTLAADGGMLFVFSAPEEICMWMKDTYVPLAAAFIGADGVIHHTAAMTPQTRESHCARETKYVLETRQELLNMPNGGLQVSATVHIPAAAEGARLITVHY